MEISEEILTMKANLTCCRLTFSLAAPERLAPIKALTSALSESKVEDVVEVILQSIPYSGFPGAVEILGHIEVSSLETVQRITLSPPRNIFQEVYGAASDKVRDSLRQRHPDLESWILNFAYGTVMPSSSWETRDLEKLAISSLLGQMRMTPFHSHLRGALRCGCTVQELQELLEGLNDIAHPDALKKAFELLSTESKKSQNSD